MFISFPVYLNISTSCNGLEMVENDVYDNGTFDEHRFCPPIQSKTYEKNTHDPTILMTDHLYQNFQICGLSHSQIVGFKCSLPHYSFTSLAPPIEKSRKS